MTSGGSADEEPPLLTSPSAEPVESADPVEARPDANESSQQEQSSQQEPASAAAAAAAAVQQQPQEDQTDNTRCDDASMHQQQQRQQQQPPSVVYHHTRDASIQTRHLVVYNTGPAVGVDELTLRRVFEAYGTVERVLCVNPAAARVLVTFHEVASAARAKAERNRPPEIEEHVRMGVSGAALASDVFAPEPGKPCPLLGRWLKVAFADVRLRHNRGNNNNNNTKKNATVGEVPAPPALPAHLTEFKAFDALAAGGATSCDSRPTPCPLCGRACGGQRGLRMHLVGAHPLEVRDREHFVQLLKMGSDLLPPRGPDGGGGQGSTSTKANDRDNHDDNDNGDDNHHRRHQDGAADDDDADGGGAAGEESGGAWSGRRRGGAGAGAAAKGRAAAALPPGFALARAGDVEGLRRVVGGAGDGGRWDPKTAMDKNGSSALDWAAGEGRLEVCRYLLNECGVDAGKACPTRGRGEGRTSLHWAARGGHAEVCRLLLETPRPVDDDTAVEEKAVTEVTAATAVKAVLPEVAAVTEVSAVTEGHCKDDEVTGGFAVSYAGPDTPAAEGTTPLHWACWGAHLSTCRLLVDRGADHRRVNAYGCTVAHWCGLSGDVDVCRWLSRSVEEGGAGGLDWSKTNLQGHTICHKAALKGHRGLLEWLWQETVGGVVPEKAWARDEGGYTPQDIARLAGHVDLSDWMGQVCSCMIPTEM